MIRKVDLTDAGGNTMEVMRDRDRREVLLVMRRDLKRRINRLEARIRRLK